MTTTTTWLLVIKIALKANRGEFKSEGPRAGRKRGRQRDEETIGRM